jgi:copper transport protein
MMPRLLLAALLLCAGEAAGHAELVSSSPPDGASLAVPPSRVELRFNEPVTPLGARLIDGSGASLPLSSPRVAGERMEVALPALGQGRYTLSFRVVSLDSHPVGGAIAFGVGVEAGETLAAQREPRGWPVLLRALRDLALLVAAGAALFLLAIARFPHERAVLAGAGLLAAAAASLAIGVHGSVLLGGEAGIASADAWRAGLAGSFGQSSLVAGAAALLIAATSRLAPGAARSAALALGALGAVACLPLTGHAASRGSWAAPAALAAHGAAAAFWAGSLAALWMLVARRAGTQAVRALERFSRLGAPAVLVLLVAGGVLAVQQVDVLSDLPGSRYGILIFAKLALFAALLVLASLNRWRYLPQLRSADAAARSRLKRSIGAEIALMGCVVALTAVLVQTPPPRTSAFSAVLRSGGALSAELSVSPARAGVNAITVRFRDAQGRAVDPEEVAIAAANEAAGVEPAVRPLRRVRAGEYRREGAELAFAGGWALEIRARVGDFDRVTFAAEVPVR